MNIEIKNPYEVKEQCGVIVNQVQILDESNEYLHRLVDDVAGKWTDEEVAKESYINAMTALINDLYEYTSQLNNYGIYMNELIEEYERISSQRIGG